MSGVGGFQYPNKNIPEFPDHYARGPRGNSASMNAAAEPDSRVLQATLAQRIQCVTLEDGTIDPRELRDTCGPNSIVEWPGQDSINTPLLQAIRSQLPRNVEILLKAGANPNGIDLNSLESYQALFLRFRPSIPDYVDIDGDVADRKTLLSCMELSQTAAITIEEIEGRLHYITPFWASHTAVPVDMFPGGDDTHSVVAAAKQPSTQIIDLLLKAGADISTWTSDSTYIYDPTHPTPSSLAVKSPLHAAVTANVPMIPYLLSLGFDPDFIPSSTPGACLTHLMSIFLIDPDNHELSQEADRSEHSSESALPKSFNLLAYTAFITHPSLNPTLTTPILGIHLFHLAVAHGSLPLFKHVISTIPISPASIVPTALGHNLLHIACLPISVTDLKTNSLAVTKSIHETRSLIYPRIRHSSTSHSPTTNHHHHHPSHNPPPPSASDNNKAHHPAQTALIAFLTSTLPHQITTEQDVYGNTALHYLAAHTFPNQHAISILRSTEDREAAWSSVRNRWGYSAKDLFESTAYGGASEKEGEEEGKGEEEEEIRAWRENTSRQLRAQVRKRDDWWSGRLGRAQGESLGEDMRTRGGARGGGRGGGVRMRKSSDNSNQREDYCDEFPYHVRTLT